MECSNGCAAKEICVDQGAVYEQAWRYGIDPLVYKAIGAMTNAAPFTLTVPAHGVLDGWNVAFLDLGDLDQLNAAEWEPIGSDFHTATVIDADTLEFNTIDANRFGSYTGGGKIAYYTPRSLDGASAQFAVYPPAQAGEALTPALTVDATLDDDTKTISVSINPTQTAALTLPEYTFALVFDPGDGNKTVIEKGVLTSRPIGATP